MPFTAYWWRNGTGCTLNSQTVISSSSQGDNRPAWELIYNHYAILNGATAPYSTAYADRNRPEGGGGNYGSTSGGYDQLGFGTLTCTLNAGSPIANGSYMLQSEADSNYLDGYGFTTNGSAANQYAWSGSLNQQWRFTKVSGSTYTITENGTGLLLDSLGNTGNGALVGQWAASGSPNQQWTITSLGGGYYKIQNVANGLCLDTGGLTANGSQLQMWASGYSYNQRWFLHAP